LANVIDAHGGFDRWKKLNSVTATIVTGGGLTGTAARLAMKRTNSSSTDIKNWALLTAAKSTFQHLPICRQAIVVTTRPKPSCNI
jgi:hypothetical protein